MERVITKFGVKNKQIIKEGRPGIGFKLTKEGDYDVQNSRIVCLSSPEQPQDAATKEYVDQSISLFKNDIRILEEEVRNLQQALSILAESRAGVNLSPETSYESVDDN